MQTILVLLLLAAPADAKDGMAPYTPTKLEWMAVENHNLVSDHMDAHGFTTALLANHPNTIVLTVIHKNTFNRALAETLVKNAKATLEGLAKIRKWNWLRIETQFREIKN